MKCYSYIRFSKKEQSDGRSYGRQMEAARKFANEKGWELDETLCMYDEGKSGFHGEHISTKGALGEFFRRVKIQEIPVPSALLVENLDRLSRGAIPDALTQLFNLIRAGITVVTLMDRQVYDNDSINKDMTQLMISISIMSRAHEESKTKQIRRGDVWAKGREKAKEGKKIPARCAAWLKFNEEKTEFVEIPERVEVVRLIYDLYIEGHGLYGICKILNGDNVLTFQKGTKGWGTTTVRRILSSRTVLGEMQFKHTAKIIDGKRIHKDIGEPIKDYYPQIIDDRIFYQAQEQMELRKCSWGKIGVMNNLFKGLVKCGHCGATMQYATRGRNKHKYLNCRESRRNNCEAGVISFRYDHLEEAFLHHCTRLNLPDVVRDDISEHKRQIMVLEAELFTVTNKLTESIAKVKNWTNALGAGSSEDTVQQLVNLMNLENEKQREYVKSQDELKRKIGKLSKVHKQTETSLKSLREAIAKVTTANAVEREKIRRKLQKVIRQLVERIDIYPRGAAYLDLKEYAATKDIYKSSDTDIKWIKDRLGKKGSIDRSCDIIFRAGGFLRLVHDPITSKLKFDMETDGHGITKKALLKKIKRIRKNSSVDDLNELFMDDLIRLWGPDWLDIVK